MSDDDKRRSKQARTVLTQPQASSKEPAPKPVASADNARTFTVQQWARGRTDAITKAFVVEHAQQRTLKRTAAAWAELYQGFLQQPRG